MLPSPIRWPAPICPVLKPLGSGNLTGVGSMGRIQDFGNIVSLGNKPARGAHVTLQVFGDDASGIHPPGTDLNVVPVTLFTGLEAFRLYEVEDGDSLSTIAQQQGETPLQTTFSKPTGTGSTKRT
jgi:hypothetical protein